MITMLKNIKGILEAAAEDMNCIAKTQSANYLFTVQEDGITLTILQAELFRTLMAKILFVRCQSRHDLNMTLAFLAMRVWNPDEDDYRELVRTIYYIRAT